MNIYKQLCLSLSLLTPVCWADVVVIVNPALGAVSEDEIQRIFLGKKSAFSDGTKATPYYLAESLTERGVFDQQALGKSSSQLKAYWSQLVFTGKGTPPAELSSSAEAVAKVAADKSAIAYVDAGAVNSSVKVIATFK